jgi:hypothetical protein
LPSPAEWRGKKDEKILTAPLTFILSRKGREEMEGKNLTELLTLPSPTAGRGKKEDEKILTMPSHPTISRGAERVEGKEKGVIRF